MNEDDLRRLFAKETPATAKEAAQTRAEIRTNPGMARKLLLVLYAMSGEDREFNQLLNLVLKVATMQLVARAMADDETFALQIGELILDGMEQMKPTPRGKKARSA